MINLIKKKIKDYCCYIKGEKWTEGGSSICLMGVLNATGHFPKPNPTQMLSPWKEGGENLARLKLAPSDYQGRGGQVRNEKTGRVGKKMQEYHFSV